MHGTTLITHKGDSPSPRVHNKLLYCWLSSCNKGLTNPKYKGTQQDLTYEKERLQGYVGLRGIKVSLKQESRLTLHKSLLMIDPYFQYFSPS